MNQTILISLVFLIVCLIVFGIIKLVCRPIKTLTAILLVLPTIATCGIVLIIYKLIHGAPVMPSSQSTIYKSQSFYDDTVLDSTSKKSEKSSKKKAASSYTDNFGKTTYYDESGNSIASGIKNAFGETTYTDSKGNYAGESIDNGIGRTTYTDKDGNVTSSNTNYLGEENFENGTTTTNDNFGNKYYH